MTGPDADRAALARGLDWLDARLLVAVDAAEARFGAPGADPFRGLHLAAADVTAGFGTAAGVPRLGLPPAGPLPPSAPLARLADLYGLADFDAGVLLVCLAPEVDLRYERVYAYLQDDVRRRRPTVELVLDLLCADAAGKLARRDRFAADAPLVAPGLLLVDAPEGDPAAPLLARTLRLDPQVVDFLLGSAGLDGRLAGWCRWLMPDGADPRPEPATVTALTRLVTAARARSRPLRVYLHGPDGSARSATAGAVSTATGVPVLHADLAAAAGTGADARPGEHVAPVLRAARLRGALVHLDGVDAVREDPAAWSRLLDELVAHDGVALLAGTRPWPVTGDRVTGTVTVTVAPAPDARRRACWAAALARHSVALPAADVAALARRFRLDVAQIDDAAAAAPATAGLRGSGPVRLEDVSAAARDRSGHELAVLTRRIRPRCGWTDLVLPPDTVAQLRELCARVHHRERVLTEWGFDRRGTLGLGTSALFTGASGTGKSTAAQIVAGELGLDLYSVDLGQVVSKYIGETEKNLGRIFDAARDVGAVLFFDEADALFGRRSEVRDSHDRYANIEVSFLLQRIEQFDGLVILATNLRQHLDEAMLRRLAFAVSFPVPDLDSRLRIWQGVWPDVPLAPCVDLEVLAARFPLSGGNIRNIALAASFLAAADGGVVRMEHLMHATRREYQKLGKALGPAELAVASA